MEVHMIDLLHFKPEEFNHPDNMDSEFLQFLDEVRIECGVPFYLTSDYRTGSGLHPLGRAVDLATPGSRARDSQKYYEELWLITDAVMLQADLDKEKVQLELVKGPTDWHVHIGLYDIDWGGPSKLVVALD